MRCLIQFTAVLLLATLVVNATGLAADDETSVSKRPNIVFILADDLGFSELGCYGNAFNETPNLDSMATEGMRFTQAYAAAPVCSPYRAAFLTGQHPARTGIVDYLRPNSANGLATDHITLPKMLQRSGYATGMIGKWHLTGYKSHDAEFEVTPREHGFDWDIARERKGVSNGVNFWPYEDRKLKTRWLDLDENRLGGNEFLVDRMNLEAVDFITRNKDRPFFLYLSHYAPHSIVNGKPKLVEKYRKKHAPGASSKTHCVICAGEGHEGCPGDHWATSHNPHLAAMLESIDDGIGMITRKLEELGLADNTIVIFTSDNGGETNVTSNTPLRGGKSQLYEGGIRVPMIVRWPGTVPKGSVTDNVTVNTDFYPTLMDAANIEPDSNHRLDGLSTLNSWRDPDAITKRDFIAWHYPLDRPHFLGGVSGGAIRSEQWKLIEKFDESDPELYDLESDPSEKINLATQHPETAKALAKKLSEWRETIGARNPSPPILTEPGNLYFGDHFKPGMVSERLWYTRDWIAENGILKRLKTGSGNTRIFLRDAEFKDAMIRFDFRLGNAKDVRLMTGSGGGYNAVIHLRPNHFFVQTALDRSVPYFPRHHGECAYDFESDRWYTMTVEFLGDEVIAHIDRDHLAYAKHPVIDRTRQYFAIQVDEHEAAFDNVQIFSARALKNDAAKTGRELLASAKDKHPVEKTLDEQFQIQKTNTHAILYQDDETYRELVKRVDELDQENKDLFPDAYRSQKEFRKSIAKERKRLHENDPAYKETLFATHRADRAIENWLIEQKPEVENFPRSRKEAEIERLRQQFADDKDYLNLVATEKASQEILESNYPQLFVSDEQIKRQKAAANEKANRDPKFKRAKEKRAAAYRAQQDYLFGSDAKLSALDRMMKAKEKHD